MTSNRPLTTVLLAFMTVGALLISPAAANQSEIVVEGGGWGHGIGMSQYGAYGQALEGKTAEEITAHYYAGSSTGQIANQVGSGHFLVTDNTPLWVNLLANRTGFGFEALGGSLTVCQSGFGCGHEVTPGTAWTFVAAGDGTCRFEADGVAVTNPGPCQATVKGLSPGGARIRIDELDASLDEFARGRLRIRTPNGGAGFHVSLETNLEDYMYGLSEVPFSWPEEALQAQVLAGRSYATWRLISRGPEAEFSQDRKAACWCHMYATTVDQAYRGWANETYSNFDRWKNAVDATAGTVITHPEASQANVVAAFYSSSTGGRTENASDIWGGSPVGYLTSQPDDWSQEPAVNNPFASWSFPFTENELAAEFGVDQIDGIEIVDRFDSGTPSVINIHTRTGAASETIVRSGPQLYTALGLRGRHISEFDHGVVTVVGGDFTGDGREDVAMAIPFNNAWWVGRSAKGRFAERSWRNFRNNNALSYHVSGDFNGDGRADVAALQAGSGKLIVNTSTGSRFTVKTWATHSNPDRWGPLLVGDFDGNGTDDIAEYDSGAERWRIYRRHNGKLLREFWYDFSVADPQWSTHVVGDFNGDDLDDIVSLDAHTGGLIALLSDGTELAPHAWQALPNDGDWQSVAAADFTGDGRDDLAAYDPVTGTWWIVAGKNGTRGAAPAAWHTFPNPNQDFGAQVVGDYNDDGRADIATYNRTNGRLKVLTSDGTTFIKARWGTIPARDAVTTVLAIDANGDGRTDIAAWDNSARRWWVARSITTRFKVSDWGTLLR